tara:strand:+ start:7759 stop:8139 length:381 start_codon:yes stop_codon:yes gene_type:complete
VAAGQVDKDAIVKVLGTARWRSQLIDDAKIVLALGHLNGWAGEPDFERAYFWAVHLVGPRPEVDHRAYSFMRNPFGCSAEWLVRFGAIAGMRGALAAVLDRDTVAALDESVVEELRREAGSTNSSN